MMCTGGQLCLRRCRFRSSLPTLPFPSLNGCIDSKVWWNQVPSTKTSSPSMSLLSYSFIILSISLATFSILGGTCLDPVILTFTRLQIPASSLIPLKTASCSSRIVSSVMCLFRSRGRSRKTFSCCRVSRTSVIGLFPILRCSMSSTSTSRHVSVFPSMAFVPHVFRALARFQTSSGRLSKDVLVRRQSRNVASMLSSMYRLLGHIIYISVYAIRRLARYKADKLHTVSTALINNQIIDVQGCLRGERWLRECSDLAVVSSRVGLSTGRDSHPESSSFHLQPPADSGSPSGPLTHFNFDVRIYIRAGISQKRPRVGGTAVFHEHNCEVRYA